MKRARLIAHVSALLAALALILAACPAASAATAAAQCRRPRVSWTFSQGSVSGDEWYNLTVYSSCKEKLHAHAEVRYFWLSTARKDGPNVDGSGQSDINGGASVIEWVKYGYYWRHRTHWSHGPYKWYWVELGHGKIAPVT